MQCKEMQMQCMHAYMCTVYLYVFFDFFFLNVYVVDIYEPVIASVACQHLPTVFVVQTFWLNPAFS